MTVTEVHLAVVKSKDDEIERLTRRTTKLNAELTEWFVLANKYAPGQEVLDIWHKYMPVDEDEKERQWASLAE